MEHRRRLVGPLALMVLLAASRAMAGLNAWTSNGPFGGPLAVVDVVAASPDVVWAAGTFGGVFRSTDGGATWAAAIGNLPNASPASVAADPVRAAVAWVSGPAGVYRTADAGVTWQARLGGPAQAVSVAPSAPSTVYVVQRNGGLTHLKRTTDDGATFQQVAQVWDFVASVAVDPQSPSTVYVASSSSPGRLQKSTDGGATFVNANAGLEAIQVREVAVDPSDPMVVLATSLSNGVFRSTDAGATWHPTVGSGPAYYVSFAASGEAWSAVPGGGAARSVDGGATWTPVSGTVDAPRDIAAHPTSPGVAWVANGAGATKTVDGGTTWTPMAQGLAATSVTSIAVDPTTPSVVYAATDGVGLHKSVDGAGSWSRTSLPSDRVFAVAVDPVVPTTVWAGADRTYKSIDAGATWSVALSSGANELLPDPSTSGVLYALVGVVRKTTDGGVNWTTVQSGIVGSVRTLAMDPVAPQTLYAGTTAGTVFKTTTGGASWSPASAGLPLDGDILSIAVDPAAPQQVYVSINSAQPVHRSTDGGATWSPTACPAARVVELRVVPGPPSLLLSPTVPGQVYGSTDGGTTCAVLEPAGRLPYGYDVFALTYDPLDPRRLYAGADSGGVWVVDRHCGDGTAEPGEACDEGAANGSATACCDRQCQLRSAGATCRPSSGPCDVAETCTGAGGACPADGFRAPSFTCRPTVGPCDLDDHCSGVDAACPADAKSTAPCRAATTSCDVAEQCDGVSDACPADGFATAGTPCRAVAGPCDVAESCSGTSPVCPLDAKSTAVCRGTADVCDVAEQCDGVGNACPADGYASSSVTCRGVAGPCDVAEQCTGSGPACPSDAFLPTSAICRPAVDVCDVADHCPGTGPQCVSDAVAPDTDDDGVCDPFPDNCVDVANPGQEDADDDLVGDVCDPCTGGAVAERPKITVSKLLGVAGDERLVLSGSASMPAVPVVDPVANGLRILLTDGAGAVLLDATLPNGAFDAGSRIGWKASGSGRVFKWSGGTAPGVVSKATLKSTPAAPARWKFSAQVKRGSFVIGAGHLPLRGTIVVDSPTAETGQCADLRFPGVPAPRCTLAGPGTKVSCK